jgi:DNA helicase-2/ATP-dependent DNA helicase PcrA
MAKRGFALPGIHELSKEQEEARALPKAGQHLIIGGPGTGKSVLALLRSRRHQQDKDDYVFLVYNRLLHQASRQLCEEKLSSEQWQRWFLQSLNKLRPGCQVPRLSPDPNGWQEIDWTGMQGLIDELLQRPASSWPFLIIDEGQDMPPAFYEALVNLGVENFYVVADQNQQIVPNRNSTRQDIQNCLGVAASKVIELRENYRNTYAIARLARVFYTGDPASPPPDLPKEMPSAKRPLLYEYDPARFPEIVKRILKQADSHPDKLYGIIAPNNEVRERYYLAFKECTCSLDHGLPRIETYASHQETRVSFLDGGILVINAQACKGLEFDTVFLADISHYAFNPNNPDVTKRLFYVMVARARDQIILLKEAGQPCPVEAILPQDPDILERK